MPDVIEKMEANGILVSRIHVGAEKLDAFSQWSDRFEIPFVMLARDKASAVRQRYDALHELSHIILHNGISQKRLNDRAFYNAVEKQADKLAACLLLPAEEFTQELYAPSLDGFLALKERWGASVGAMIMRCRDLGIIDGEEARRMWMNYNRRGWRNGEPLDNKMEKESPYVIRRSFEKLIEEKVQSAAEIMAALPFPPADLEEIADLEPGTLTGEKESRAEPVLKSQFRNETSNVISIFGKKA
jgi:Zn-dependent peptidase ImmA (M78 family)